ncbi:MAG: FAD-dependent oxidoreductase [Rhodospirillaceae bacterium]|nr:FAD-dependent oxidoreductase [Rhodospirillaceae bacterium]
MIINRRSFNRSVLTAALAGPLIRSSRAKAADTADVVVIGAGLSGLNAAWMLSEAGLDVVVLEGSARIGGRVWTAHDSENTPELGASQVGPSYARVLDAIDRLGLEMVDEDRPIMPFTYHLGGQLIRAKDWADHPVNKTVGAERKLSPVQMGGGLIAKFNPMKELDDWLRPDFAKYDVSVGDMLAGNGVSPAAMAMVGLTTEMRNTSALSLMQEGLRGAFEAKFSSAQSELIGGALVTKSTGEKAAGAAPSAKWPKNFKGGASAFPQAMAKQLKRPVMTSKLVAAIHMNDDGADVRCMDGSSVRAKFVIAAVPFSVLRLIEITPALDGVHHDAIHNIGYAETARAFCTIKQPFWQQDGLDPSLFTDTPLRMLWVLDNHSGAPNAPTKGPFMATFVITWGAAERVSQMAPEEAAKLLVAEVERLRPAAKGQIVVNRFHSWARQPLQRGCRHSFKPGQIAAFAVDMIKPWQRLHVAGEHTRRLDYGMESAMESGERAAVEILNRI